MSVFQYFQNLWSGDDGSRNGAQAKDDRLQETVTFLSETYEEKYLERELKTLHQKVPFGVYVVPSMENHYVWNGVCFIHNRMYQGGVFKFVLYIPLSYPAQRPSVVFVSEVYHPLIDPLSRELDLSHRFPQWTPSKDFIFHILSYIKEIFLEVPLQHHINKEAFLLLNTDPAKFREKAKESARLSQTRVFDQPEDGSSLVFRDMSSQDFEKYRTLMLNYDQIQAEDETKQEEYFDRLFQHFPDVEPLDEPYSPASSSSLQGNLPNGHT